MKIELTNRRLLRLVWLGLCLIFLALWYAPFIDFKIRVVTWAVGLLILIGAVLLVWKRTFLRWLLIFLYGLAALFVMLPSHCPPDPSALRSGYCAALKSYRGCRYVWGGSNYFGIDCSGLVLKGLEDALAQRGIASLDPALLRASISLYWHRTTARVIGEGYSGRTFTVTETPALSSLDYSLLKPGDLAVTAGGEHVMAYLGSEGWIAGDPDFGKVTLFAIPGQTNGYFFRPMRIVRWKILSD